MFLGLGIGAVYGYSIYSKVSEPNILVGADKSKEFFIPSNSNEKDVLSLLKKQEILSSDENLAWLFKQKNYKGRNVVPGKYTLEPNWSNNDLVNHLRAGRGVEEVNVQFNQLRTKADLAGRLAKNIETDSLTIINWLNNPDSIKRYGFNQNTIISMFIPNTYRVKWNTSAPELMKRMGKEFSKFWNSDRKEKLNSIGLTESQAVTLASIVYWETKLTEDMPRVAGVYMNRIRVGMPLQADPTVIFAIGDFSIQRVLTKHTEVNSPYNTYKNAGLPPGPILIPPASYVDAVLNYEKHDYFYFVAKEDFSGASYFSKNLSQHNIYADRFRRALNERKIYR